MTTSLGWVRAMGATWQDGGQTGDDESLTDLTPVTVYDDGSVEVVGGGCLCGADEDIAAAMRKALVW